jgi:hypothetical protein
MVFARKPDAALASLVKEIDKAVGTHKDKKMASFVSLIGGDADKLKGAAKKLAEDQKIENVALTVAKDQPNGPKHLKISEDAAVTVMMYNGLKVKANHAVPAGGLSQDVIKKIVADTAKIAE